MKQGRISRVANDHYRNMNDVKMQLVQWLASRHQTNCFKVARLIQLTLLELLHVAQNLLMSGPSVIIIFTVLGRRVRSLCNYKFLASWVLPNFLFLQ